ncbi:MAG: hypothetical protein ABI147_09850, partial [Acidobacteriaceae bacterium]
MYDNVPESRASRLFEIGILSVTLEERLNPPARCPLRKVVVRTMHPTLSSHVFQTAAPTRRTISGL